MIVATTPRSRPDHFPDDFKKVIRAQNIALENRLPTIYLVDSAGIFPSVARGRFPDTDDFAGICNNAVMSAMAFRRLRPSWGCVWLVADIAVMCDHVLMTDGSGLFLAGPHWYRR